MLALAAVVAAVIVLGVLVFATAGDSSTDLETADGGLQSSSDGPGNQTADQSAPDEAAPDENGPDETVPGSEGEEAESRTCPEGTLPEVCDAVAFIESFKGDRPFLTFPVVNFIDGEAFDDFVLEDFAEGEAELRETGLVLQSLGLIDPDVDLADALRTSLELGVAGAYNTETEELNVNGTEVNLYTQSVMIHELTHAWDDQYFELARPEYDDAEGEIGSGFLNVVEGSAVLAETAWRATLTDAQRTELEELELGAISPDELELLFAVPFFVLQLQISPYVDGAAFVQSIYDRDGIDGVDALFDNPPTTTEQVFHVDAYLDGEGALEVPPVEPPFEALDQGVMGELTFDLWFGSRVADGWGGDEYVSWRSGDTTCTTVSVVGDTDADTDEFFDAFDGWVAEAPAGASRVVDLLDGTVVATGCSG